MTRLVNSISDRMLRMVVPKIQAEAAAAACRVVRNPAFYCCDLGVCSFCWEPFSCGGCWCAVCSGSTCK